VVHVLLQATTVSPSGRRNSIAVSARSSYDMMIKGRQPGISQYPGYSYGQFYTVDTAIPVSVHARCKDDAGGHVWHRDIYMGNGNMGRGGRKGAPTCVAGKALLWPMTSTQWTLKGPCARSTEFKKLNLASPASCLNVRSARRQCPAHDPTSVRCSIRS
jgi:hypothetical protein